MPDLPRFPVYPLFLTTNLCWKVKEIELKDQRLAWLMALWNRTEIFPSTWPQTACALRDLRAPVETWIPAGLMFEMLPFTQTTMGAETCINILNKVTVFQILITSSCGPWALERMTISQFHMLRARRLKLCKETSYLRKNVLLDGKCFRDYLKRLIGLFDNRFYTRQQREEGQPKQGGPTQKERETIQRNLFRWNLNK